MKKQTTKKPKKVPKLSRNKKVVLTIAIFVLSVMLIQFLWFKVSEYKDMASRAQTEPLRSYIIKAVGGHKSDAPIDAKTGDVYFPQAKIYLPSTVENNRLTYGYYEELDGSGILSISSHPALNQALNIIYSAGTVDELLNAVPKLQACQRGITFLQKENKPDFNYEENELQYTLELKDGRTYYVYYEKSCPELEETSELLRNLNSY